jgi:hypothetical protein
VREKLDTAGCEPKSAPRAQFADIIKADVALWAKVVKDGGLSAEPLPPSRRCSEPYRRLQSRPRSPRG